MKKKLIIFTALFLIAIISTAQETRREKRKAREKARMEEVMQLFENRTLQFLAQSAHPMAGGMIHLTSSYTLTIKDQEVTSWLPYYGVAYRAEYPAGDGGIKFSETALAPEWKSTKKGYEISMQVKTTKDVYQIHLLFSRNGYGTLQVTCINRQPIRFSGIIQAIQEEKS